MYLREQGSCCELYQELWIECDTKSQESKMLNHANYPQAFLTFFKYLVNKIHMHNPPCRGIFGVSPAPIMLPIATPSPWNFQEKERYWNKTTSTRWLCVDT